MMKKLIIIFSLYVAYCLLLYIIQRQIIFPGRNIKPPSGIPKIKGIERVWLATSAGRVEAWFIPAEVENGKKRLPAVVFAHGNYEIIDYCIDDAGHYNRLGVHVMLVEYPGYGRSDGSPSEESIGEAMTAAYDWLAENPAVERSRIMAHGRSLGGGAAVLLASQRELSGLVLQSTFTHTGQFARRYLAPSFLVRDNFNNLPVLENFHKPVMIFHGRRDLVIPFKNGEKLARAAKKVMFFPLRCGHNDCNIYGSDFKENVMRMVE
jgi:fermentation-respiration switch protein FrsA (DUF1100 family)